MPPWNRLTPQQLLEERRFAAFRRRLSGMASLKLGRTLDACRALMAVYERDNTERRNPAPFLQAKRTAERELEAVEGELRYREMGPDGPFR